ncbi:SlyX family protein [Jiella avicenniae]|uniref:SlyX family protein n=1 Tax=Jiella avicenniae TaxID=2907202 RepID=A0A9X1T6C6_9HYPH|nr:SlyX family protein [Jiella avicenniae]MCE7030461.1 SlyX family protein [Jiella avicenniae]
MSEPNEGAGPRIEDLEVMVAHQARTIDELSEELTRAVRMIERLQHLIPIPALTDSYGIPDPSGI